jgi:hypothetical protein
MKTLLLSLALLLPATFLVGQPKKKSTSKTGQREISPARLPARITKFISLSLPHAKITKAVKQKKNPKEKYFVTVRIKTFTHVLVFNKDGDFVRLIKKKGRLKTPD